MMKTFINLMTIVVAMAMMAPISEAGTHCPPRESIYPCLCTNIQLSKKQVFTDITCRHLSNTESLSNMFHELQQMSIDRFIIYDSFWGVDDHQQKRLPDNWFSMLRIKELRIVDSDISHDIACAESMVGCPNNVPTHLTLINSSYTDEFVTLCKGKVTFSWINCLKKLQNFHFIKNKLKKITSNFFSMPLTELLVANFSHNGIKDLESGAFKNLPKLTTLDLSYNMIRNINDIFGDAPTVIAHLDLSWNFLMQLPADLFKKTPLMTYFGVTNNRIQKLPEDDWKHISKEIRTLDLIGNLIQCDCHIIWINCTFKVHAVITGFCVNEEYLNTPLRRVSKFMSERCVDGEILERKKNDTRNACDNWDKRRSHLATPIRVMDNEIDGSMDSVGVHSPMKLMKTRKRKQ